MTIAVNVPVSQTENLLLLYGINIDGLVKSPSVPLGAGLRFNFVVAGHL
jgi:hypothetical protein